MSIASTFHNDPGYVAKDYHQYSNFKEKLLEEGKPCPGRISFWYENSKSEITARVVDTIAWSADGKEQYLLAFGHLRKEHRAFKSRGMWALKDRQTQTGYNSFKEWLEGRDAPGTAPVEPPTAEQFEAWTQDPKLASASSIQAFFKKMTQSHDALIQQGELRTFEDSDHRATLSYFGPKKRGEGLIFRANLDYWPSDVSYIAHEVNGVSHLEQVSSRFRSKPWTVYVAKGGGTFQFELFKDAWGLCLQNAS